MKWTPRVSATQKYINARPCQSHLPFPVSRTHRRTSTLGLVRVISPFRCLGHTDIHQRSALSESSPLSDVSDTQTYINARPCKSNLPFPASRPHIHQHAASSESSPFFTYVGHTCIKTRPCQSSPLFMCLGHTKHTSTRGLVGVIYNNNNVHLSCADQRPERSHDTYESKCDILYTCKEYTSPLFMCLYMCIEYPI